MLKKRDTLIGLRMGKKCIWSIGNGTNENSNIANIEDKKIERQYLNNYTENKKAKISDIVNPEKDIDSSKIGKPLLIK